MFHLAWDVDRVPYRFHKRLWMYQSSVLGARAKFGRGEIRVIDGNGSVERTISFDQTDAKL